MLSVHSSFFVFWTYVQVTTVLVLLVNSQNRPDEVLTLLSFKTANSWFTSTYWSNWKESDENPCGWVGVTCTDNYTVWELDLSGWGGFLAQDSALGLGELSNLKDLRQLSLSSNNMINFPENVETLTALTRLDLSNNLITGGIPPNISACRNLRFVSLQQNFFSGEIPSLRGLENLESLFLADNKLSGPLSKELDELTSLVTIDISNNLLNGSIPALPNLTNLVKLKLDNNSFTEFEDKWVLSTNNVLDYFSASFNQLEGLIPSSVTDLLNLEILNFSCNRLSGSIPLGFSQLMKHKPYLSVDLSQNQLTGQIPTDMLQQPDSSNCASFNLSYNLLSGNIPNHTVSYLCIYTLDLSHNNLSGPIPISSFNGAATEVDVLWLHDNHLSGDIVSVLLEASALIYSVQLRLQNNLFTGDLSRIVNSPVAFGLEVVDFSNNDLRWSTSGAILDPITATLEKLTLGQLTEFRAGGNNFTGTSLPSTCFVNQSSGNEQLQVLDLSNTHLTGEVLGTVFNDTCLSSLQFLNLSNNDIIGGVPDSIISLPSLTVLDLSYNKLSGPLPTIPPSSNLFNPSYFAGNDGLCGYPLLLCLSFKQRAGVQWWVLLLIIGGAVIAVVGSCLATTWRWKLYHKRHEQDADLIRTLMERDSATLMSLKELRKATDNFAKTAQIGEGGFGTVYTGKLNDGTIVAIKRSKHEGSEKDKDQFLNEVRILSHVNHRNLVKLLGCCMENQIAVLVFEFVQNGTLQEHLQGKIGVVRLDWKQRLNIAVQTADALNYLHSGATFPIYHRDVKSANILLDNDHNAKVADFGISRLASVHATHVSTAAIQGTMGYIDPEYYTSYQLTDKSDVYSFGVVLLELISSKPALDFSRGGEDTSLINLASPYIENEDLQQLIDPALVETYNDLDCYGRGSILNIGKLAMKCLDMRSKARPTMNEVLEELQTNQKLWLKHNGTSMYLDNSISTVDNEDKLHYRKLLPESSWGDSSSSMIQSDVGGIQMSQFS